MIVAHRPTALPAAILGVAACTALLALSFTRSVARPGTDADPLPAPVPPAVAETLSPSGAAPHAAHDDGDRLDQLFPSGVVATVNDHAITVADVRLHVAPLLPVLRQEARSPEEFAGRLQLLHNSAIKDLVNRAVLIRQFRETRDGDLPRQVAPEQIDTYLADEVRERFGGDRARFLAYLRARNLTVRDYRREVEEDIIYRYMRAQERKLANRTSAPPANPADQPVRLRIIQLTRTADATDASLLARAREIVARFHAGEAFAQLAQEFDQSGKRARGGDWGWIGAADLKPAFRESVMGLTKGQAAEPILLPEGCFLLYADDRR